MSTYSIAQTDFGFWIRNSETGLGEDFNSRFPAEWQQSLNKIRFDNLIPRYPMTAAELISVVSSFCIEQKQKQINVGTDESDLLSMGIDNDI